jgi:hypothetical protein
MRAKEEGGGRYAYSGEEFDPIGILGHNSRDPEVAHSDEIVFFWGNSSSINVFLKSIKIQTNEISFAATQDTQEWMRGGEAVGAHV